MISPKPPALASTESTRVPVPPVLDAVQKEVRPCGTLLAKGVRIGTPAAIALTAHPPGLSAHPAQFGRDHSPTAWR